MPSLMIRGMSDDVKAQLRAFAQSEPRMSEMDAAVLLMAVGLRFLAEAQYDIQRDLYYVDGGFASRNSLNVLNNNHLHA